MISPHELRAALRKTIDDERHGVRTLDPVLVKRATEAKERILAGMLAVPSEERAPLLAVLESFKDELRDNLVLLAHARAHLHDATKLLRVPGGRQLLEIRHGVQRVNESIIRMKARVDAYEDERNELEAPASGTGT